MTRPEDFADMFTGHLSADVTSPQGPTVHVEYGAPQPYGDYYTGSPDLAMSSMAAVDIRDEAGAPIARHVLSRLPPQVLGTVTEMMINRDPAADIARIIREGMAGSGNAQRGRRKRT